MEKLKGILGVILEEFYNIMTENREKLLHKFKETMEKLCKKILKTFTIYFDS